MRTWRVYRAQSIAPRGLPPWTARSATGHGRPLSTTSGDIPPAQDSIPARKLRSPLERRYPVFERFSHVPSDAAAWTALLDGALPPHLRSANVTPPALPLSAVDVAQILLAAQYPWKGGHEPMDLLYHLGIEQGRWSAVVWLIKKLVDKFPARHAEESRLARVGSIWQKVPDLYEASRQPLQFEVEDMGSATTSTPSRSLDDLLDGLHPVHRNREESLRHDALGQVWRTLGAMVKACVGGETKPEVLEIIAYLHHREVMPLAIYQAEPISDSSAIQQPPLIPFLSSRILTSLSDAAWRAHEKLVVDEARANGSQYATFRPEIPGSVFRVHVAGLRAEVWMELILWSCLYGGWIRQGMEVLRSLVTDKTHRWAPLSWTDYQKSLPSNYGTEPRDWRSWEFLFKTKSATSMDDAHAPIQSVERTISGEVVNAYIDAVSCTVNVGVGARGVNVEDVLDALHDFKKFLKWHKQSLSFGTWNSLMLRILDTNSITPEHDSGNARKVVAMSDGFGDGLYDANTQHMPAYVQDGSMAMQGVLHRALYGQVAAGSFEGALAVFKQIQHRADVDKIKSVASFFGQGSRMRRSAKTSLFQTLDRQDMFTSNVSSVDYPAFEVQIPPTVLARFLDQVTQANAFEFGRWLLHKADVDGPVIRPSAYNDTHLQPALIRFAAASNDEALLTKFKDSQLGRESLRSVFDSLVQRRQWDDARQVLEHLASTPGPKFRNANLANLVRTMLLQVPAADEDNTASKQHLERAKVLLTDMVSLKFEPRKQASPDRRVVIQSLLTVLAAVDSTWFHFAYGLRIVRAAHHKFRMLPTDFNIILEGVVTTKGSAAGRHLLGIFWPHSARSTYDAPIKMVGDKEMQKRMPRARPEILNSIQRQRIVVAPRDQPNLDQLVVYGAMIPNTNTILIILRRALEETQTSPSIAASTFQPSTVSTHEPDIAANDTIDMSPRGIVAWAVQRLAELPYVEGSIIEELEQTLTELGMDELRADLPKICEVVETELDMEIF